MGNINLILEEIKKELENFVKDEIYRYREEILEISKEFIEKNNDDIKKWSMAVLEKRMEEDEFEDLVLNKRDNLELLVLQKIGESKIRRDKFIDSLSKCIINSIVKSL